jgi:epidermal growth factor receptor substrate 15
MKYFVVLFISLFLNNSIFAQLSEEKKAEFNKLLRQADLLFSQNKFLEAKGAYESALAVNPNDKYALNQRDKSVTNAKDNTKGTEDKNYQKIVNKADEKFNASNYQDAKSLYERALTLKPTDPYPKRKIEEIEALLNPKPVKKADPLPDLGVSSNMTITDAEKLLREAEIKRQNIKNQKLDSNDNHLKVNEADLTENRIKEMNASSTNIQAVKDKIELNTISTKEQQDSLNIKIQQNESRLSGMNENLRQIQRDKNNNEFAQLNNTLTHLDSVNFSTKTAGAEMDVFITLKTKRFSDSVAIAEQKIKDDMYYRTIEINMTNQKEEKKYYDNQIDKNLLNEIVNNTNQEQEKKAFETTESTKKEVYLVKEEVNDIAHKNEVKENKDIQKYKENREKLNPSLSKQIQSQDSLSVIPTNKSFDIADQFEKVDGKAIDSLTYKDNENKQNKSNQMLAVQKVLSNDNDNNVIVRAEASNKTQEGIKKLKEDNTKFQIESKESQDASIEELKKAEQKNMESEHANSIKERDETYGSMDQMKTLQSKVITAGSETNVNNGSNSTNLNSQSNVLSGNSSIETQKQNDKKQDVRDFLENMDSRTVKFDEKAANSIGALYAEGVTEESFNKTDDQGLPYAVVTRRIVVINGHGTVYTRTQTLNTITYTKNGLSTTEYIWQLETQDAKLKRN